MTRMLAVIALTLGVSLAGSAQLRNVNGSLVTPNCADGQIAKVVAGAWACAEDATGAGGESIPAGSILLIASGACPTGYSEVAALNGKVPVGTLAASKNIGETGGADTITPAGNVAAPTFSGTPFTDVIAHTHPVQSQTATTGGASSYEHGTVDTSSTAAESLPTGSTGGVASITPAGTNSAPGFTGTQFDNRSAFVRVIYCAKT